MGNNDDALVQSFDRVAIPAVLMSTDDISHAARSAGIHEPIVIPVTFGDDTTVMLGDRFTPNLTGVFEPEEAEGDDPGGWDPSEPDDA